MTSIYHRPSTTNTGGAEVADSADQRSREATNRCIANLTNATERHFRRTMASQEDISDKARIYAERHDQGIAGVIHLLEEVSDQVAEGHQKQNDFATKAEVAEVKQLLLCLLKKFNEEDFVLIPKEERVYTLDPEEEI